MATLNTGSLHNKIPSDPEDVLGVYKTYDDVDSDWRLSRINYGDRDVWGEWVRAEKRDLAESTLKYKYKPAERRWKNHMDSRGRHHALATPDDVETYLAAQLEDVKPITVFNTRYEQLYQFYNWLLWHTDYTHLYNPVIMAAAQGGAARKMWNVRIDLQKKNTK